MTALLCQKYAKLNKDAVHCNPERNPAMLEKVYLSRVLREREQKSREEATSSPGNSRQC